MYVYKLALDIKKDLLRADDSLISKNFKNIKVKSIRPIDLTPSHFDKAACEESIVHDLKEFALKLRRFKFLYNKDPSLSLKKQKYLKINFICQNEF